MSASHTKPQPPRVLSESDAVHLRGPAVAGLVLGALLSHWRKGRALDPVGAARGSIVSAPIVAGLADYVGDRSGIPPDDRQSRAFVAFLTAAMLRLSRDRIGRAPGFRPTDERPDATTSVT